MNTPNVFVTVSAYHMGRMLGMERAVAELHRQIETPNEKSEPCVRTIARLRGLADVGLRLDTGATCIGKARSRAFHAAFDSEALIWVSCDDDVEATSETLASLLCACYGVEPRIVIVPCVLRHAESGEERINIRMPMVQVERRVHVAGRAAKLIRVDGGGFGLVAMNRAAMIEVLEENSHLRYLDDDDVVRCALFHDSLVDEHLPEGQVLTRWYGEDLSFFHRVPKSVTVEALTDGHSAHAGHPLALSLLA